MSFKSPLVAIFLVIFIDLIGFGIVIPILPYYAVAYGASATTLGWLMVCYSGMQFLFAPFWGRLSDKIGRRPVILTCIVGIAISMTILGLAKSLAWLVAARLLNGFFGANISAASAYIADVTTPENRAKGMGLIGAAFGLGFLFGPVIGGTLSQWGYGVGPLAAAGLAGLNFLFARSQLQEPTLTAEARAAHRHRFDKDLWYQIAFGPKTGAIIICFFFVTLAMAQLETAFALFLLARYHLDAHHAGYILGLMGLVMAAIQGGAIGRLAKTVGEIRLILTGAIFMAMALVGASLTYNLKIFIGLLLVYATGYAITNPSLLSLVSRSAPPGAQGATMGCYQSAGSLGRILGPLAAGFFFDRVSITAPFWTAALLFVLILGVVIQQRRAWTAVGSG